MERDAAKPAPTVDRRGDSRIVRSALDEVKAIQTLLADVYKDAGDGRTLVRELVQNADDARAARLVFVVLEQGWRGAGNSLLRGPGLLIANDGPFPVRDRDALHQALGGSKAEDAGKVGRFGIGLKSVFHICEAIVYVGADGGTLRPGALNPWAGTGEGGNADPIHPDWDKVDDEDLGSLVEAATVLLGRFDDGLLQWIPLRRDVHLDRAQDRRYGLGQVCPSPQDVAGWFGRSPSLALLLAQCGYLRSIEADRASDPSCLGGRARLAHVVRPAFEPRGWVGRHEDDPAAPDRFFDGVIEDAAGKKVAQRWSVAGVESLGLRRLRDLRSDPEWPSDPHWQGGRSVWLPRKALAHAAVTIVRGDGVTAAHRGARVRWAVFLPLDDDPEPRSTRVAESLAYASVHDAWDIVLHGYFWPSHDRRSIPGVTDDDEGVGDSALRVRWNRAVRDELLLPLLPSALAQVVRGLLQNAARDLVGAVAGSRIVADQLQAVTKRHVLLPVLTEDGVRWETRDHGEPRILSVPAWSGAPAGVRKVFAAVQTQCPPDVVFIDADSPRIGGEPDRWQAEELDLLLGSIRAESLGTAQEVAWAGNLVGHVLASGGEPRDTAAVSVAQWVAQRIADGALAATTGGPLDDAREELRTAWRRLAAALPGGWLVEAPVESQGAVVELASAGLLGEGLLPIPLGRRPSPSSRAAPDPERLDRALLELGRRLSDAKGVSQRAQRSRLLLAETLLATRKDVPLGDELGSLPLLRARRLPDDKDEPWSIRELRRQTERRRVFARPSTDSEDDDVATPAPQSPSDPKRAVHDLAEALGEDAWLVDAVVASTTSAPAPTSDALAAAVVHTDAIRSDPLARLPLLRRIGAGAPDDAALRAVRMLLTARCDDRTDDELYYVRSQDSQRATNCRSLEILLGLLNRPWCAVEPALVEPLPHALVEQIRIRAIDAGVLRSLLRQALGEGVDWSDVEASAALHLLRNLYGVAHDEKTLWRAMPLHRGCDGKRGPFDDRALRATGKLRLPPELAAEIRLLDPDPEVADLYNDVPALDEDGILHAMLVSTRPWLFAERIVGALRRDDGVRVSLPRNEELLQLLGQSVWLPAREGEDGVAPKDLLILPEELRLFVAPLARSGVLGGYRVAEDLQPGAWSASEDVVIEILGRPGRSRQVQQLARAIDRGRIASVDDGAFLILPDARHVEVSLIGDARATPLVGSHPGWGLVHAAAATVGGSKGLDDASATAQEAVAALARALCGPMPAARQASVLKTLAASRPSKDSPAGRMFLTLVGCFAETERFFRDVLPELELPTQDGQWHPSREVARSASGVARRHRVLSALRTSLQLDSDVPVRVEAASDTRIASGTAEALAKYFEPWAERLPHGAVGAFLGLLGDGKDGAVVQLAEEWLGDDVSVGGMRRSLAPTSGPNRCASVKVFVSGRIAQGKRVEAVNLLGEPVEMEAGSDDDTIFATDPVRRYSVLGDFWEISLRDVEPRQRTAHELIRLLGATVEWWAVWILRLDRQAVRTWWSQWGTGSQAQVGPVRASILAHLPLTLHQLDVRECPPLRDALRDAQRAQRRREQAPPAQLQEAMDAERAALDHLSALILDDPDHRRFLWERVQDLMQRFGYRADSVLLELAQNADDALAQAAEIAGGSISPAARHLLVRVDGHDGTPTLDVTHFGRPINDTGGAAFAEGRERQWDQDLYFMMLLNLSGKPGEAPGQSVAASTTGRFGLGFKSVHLVSTEPSVVSGFLAFSIAGGLLPSEGPVPDDPDLVPVEGHRATRVRLPLRQDVPATDLLDSLFRRFSYARALLPAFARQLREVVVAGGPAPGVSTFDGQSIARARGWTIASEATELPKAGRWRIVRFRPPNAAAGTAALAFGLRNGTPAAFPADLPFLWNVAPTSEGWGCGYAINGSFKLDPGRTHVSLDDEATLRVVNVLGEALGGGLVELHDALLAPVEDGELRLLGSQDVPRFFGELWTLLASGIDSRDELRRDLLLRLHGPGRGLSAWMEARSVVPSGLPAPFAERLPPMKPNLRLEVADGGLDNADLCRALTKIDEVAALAAAHRVVSGDVAQRLRPLLAGRSLRQLQPCDIFEELAQSWDQVLTPSRLQALRPLAADAVWKLVSSGTQSAGWPSQLVARATDGSSAPLRALLLPKDLPLPDAGADVEEELLRSAFAPDARTLDATYLVTVEDLSVFQRLRARHQVDAATMAAWYAELPEQRQPAALRYLLRGRLQQEVLERLVPRETRPIWLDDYDGVRDMLDDLGEEEWRCRQLLGALFPTHFDEGPAPQPVVLLTEAARRSFFERLTEWWDDAQVRREVVSGYEAGAWPDWLRRTGVREGLRADSADHWLGLLVLGACQSIGRAQDGHHRTFLENAHAEGWWEVFTAPDDTAPWMEVLRTWQDRAVADLSYSRWMSLFPAIYQLSRYLEKYRRLLRTAGRRPAELYRVTCLLSPRVDEALTGAGQQFDAPPAPLNMGVHWVLRELVRLEVLDGEHLFRDCWVPAEQVLRFLRPLGMNAADGGAANSEKAAAVFEFLARELHTPTPHLHRAFDIPLRHVDGNADLRRQLGLEA